MRGVVDTFDEAAGLGEVVGDDGRRYPFQCTQIADGTRSIPEGTPVRFRVWPRLGRYEAAGLER